MLRVIGMNEELLLEVLYKVARKTANKTARIHRFAIDPDDIFQSLVVWGLEHMHKLDEWKDDKKAFKLSRALANEAQRVAVKQRAHNSKIPVSDFFFYKDEVLHELLRDVWNYDNWSETSDMSSEYISHTKKPDEGGNRIAMLADVSDGLDRLSDNDRNLLRQRYANGGMDVDALAAFYSITEAAMRKRLERARRRLQEQLGGEQPQWRRRDIKNG